MRAASLVNQLREEEEAWVLVLPPWPHLYHWKSRIEQSNVPWRRFFDVASLSQFVPSIEFEEYLEREGHVIEEVNHVINGRGLMDRACDLVPLSRWASRVVHGNCDHHMSKEICHFSHHLTRLMGCCIGASVVLV